MKLFPSSALVQLEFNKIKSLLIEHCHCEYSKFKAEHLRIHTKLEFIAPELEQTHEYKLILTNALFFPSEVLPDLTRELKLVSIPGGCLTATEFMRIKKLAELTRQVFRWFDDERKLSFPGLTLVIQNTYFEKAIIDLIDDIIDDSGMVKDNASEDLARIRLALFRKRNELRRAFEKILRKLNKDGFLADIEESFMNGRRVLAVFAEQKRMIKGILHGESDSRRTSFIEPEETTELNNAILGLENDETREIYKILLTLTSKLSTYSHLLIRWYELIGEFNFIRAKAKFAIQYSGNYPSVQDKAIVNFQNAVHPLLYLHNKQAGKETVPVNISLNDKNRILVISGPNAGGKTVTMKTVALLQMMLQSGLLVSCSHDSEFGIFRQLMIHIGDTQSIEFELSTYSSHLKNMKYFMENANGKTLFFIDELGSGSDPGLGGAFAEVIMEELAKKHAIGIVTTHYLNLKVMANTVRGIINGAMTFDEQKLLPLYELLIGKPGSSYTFSIAERIGLHQTLINKARKLVDEDHFSLDKLLNRTEQDLQHIDKGKKELSILLEENIKLKRDLEMLLEKEKHTQQLELLEQQNKISGENLAYLKDMERKLKAMVIEWKKSENKPEVIKTMQALLFEPRQKHIVQQKQKNSDNTYFEVDSNILVGSLVKMKNSRQVGTVKELRGKKAIIQVGVIPITMNIKDLVAVIEKS